MTPAEEQRRYARIPVELFRLPGIGATERDVYAVLALEVWQGNIAAIRQDEIAKYLGIGKSTVKRSIAKLKSAGALRIARTNGFNAYELTSPVFGQKQGRVTEIVSLPNGYKRIASIEKCT